MEARSALREARLGRARTQQELAKALCVSRTQICNIEAGRSGLAASHLACAAAYLGVIFSVDTAGWHVDFIASHDTVDRA